MSSARKKWFAAMAVASVVAACGGGGDSMSTLGGGTGMGPGFVATSLITDVATSANPYASSNTDAHLVNSWGIAFNPEGFVWVANAGTSTSTLYDGNGVAQSLVVTIPPGSAGSASPTGIVFNGGSGFAVSQGGVTAASVFIFVGEAGTVSGWAPSVNATTAIRVVDGGAASKIYKGAALATTANGPLLYAIDFHHGTVDVFDSNFAPVAVAGGFVDTTLPAGYAPFGIQAVGNLIYVAYAMQDAQARNPVAGAGLGAVDTFDTAGRLVMHLVAPGGALDAPWGIALAPASFGAFGNALLIGNFGDGTTDAFEPSTGKALGKLTGANANPIKVDGLWGLAFGNGINAQPANTLFFAAGPADEAHGVYGRIDLR
ncbi:MAG: TIGR03118 family protein [Caldimonas sp.]